jgi:thiol:disulfide interchange protein
MNPLGPETGLLVLTDVFWLLAVITAAFAAVGVIGVLGLTLAECKQAVREQRARRQRILAASHAALISAVAAAASKRAAAKQTHSFAQFVIDTPRSIVGLKPGTFE